MSHDGQRSPSAIPARVLIVDDCRRERTLSAARVRGENNDVRFASTGPEAVGIARDWQPDLVLLDATLPGMDGFQVCRQLRADPATAQLRVFLLCTVDEAGTRLRGFEVGADDVLSKPLDEQEARARIQAIARLNRYRSIIQTHRAVAHPAAAIELLPRAELETRFFTALETLEVWFQPIVRLDGDTVIPYAHEALMKVAARPFDDPLTMLAAASTLGQLPCLSVALRERVSAAAATLQGSIFVNLTSTELADERLYRADNPLMAFADRVILEVTEREPVENFALFCERVARLRRAGFRIAIDDVGGSQSSLQRLMLLEPDFAKLDRSLITAIDIDPKRGPIVKSFLGLCRDLDITPIVEGVETEAEKQALLDLGCELMQGYLFGRARPLAERMCEPLALSAPGRSRSAVTLERSAVC